MSEVEPHELAAPPSATTRVLGSTRSARRATSRLQSAGEKWRVRTWQGEGQWSLVLQCEVLLLDSDDNAQ